MTDPTCTTKNSRRLAIAVRGVVQGVGFRPFVFNAARSQRLCGWVCNEADTVRIEVQGRPAALDDFLDALDNRHPPRARIDSLVVSEIACEHNAAETFQIRQSNRPALPRPTIPADLAICEECLREIRDPAQRRCGYPFTNCTNCGPRWSIIEQLPYDRPRTSMASFKMCAECRAEYEDPADRRFHAQPIACPRCGPALQLLDNGGKQAAVGQDALRRSADAVLAGRIVAVKGLGGFQLLADATNSEAVALIRRRKHRPHRPFALMLASLDEVRRRCPVSDEEARALSSPEMPILLLKHRRETDVAAAVAPGNPYLGVMLPNTPLHHLLLGAIARPVVCTSGNLAEEPMAIDTADALERLGGIADAILTHDRRIVRPIDDSVARVGPDGLQLLRRARGYAPLPIELGLESPTILAVGGHLKNTVALALGSADQRGTASLSPIHPAAQAVVGAHVGDLDNVLSIEVHRRAVRDLVEFFRVVPEVVACDLHPDYASTGHAEALAAEWDVPLVRVQHHHAHVAACMAEHRLEGPVLGLAWDGTGYGTDGTVWGGEALVCEGATFNRVAHLRTFGLPGGDRAVREPRRAALGLLFEVFGSEARRMIPADLAGSDDWFDGRQLNVLISALAGGVQCPRTSSMGRLFDAVATLCGLPAVISFEGQAAMALEFSADQSEEDSYPLPLDEGQPAVADWEPLIRGLLADRAAGRPLGRISARLHNALAELAVAVARRCGPPSRQVVLSGGCFQNALLTQRVRGRLLQSGFAVYTHRQVPPGDGGIALGQVFAAARRKGTVPFSRRKRGVAAQASGTPRRVGQSPLNACKEFLHVSRHPG